MKSTLRSTTALIAALATVTPGLTLAQTVPLATGQAQTEGPAGAAEIHTSTGDEDTGSDQTGPDQRHQTTCIESQSENGISAEAAADLCEGMTASTPGSRAEMRSEDARQQEAIEQAEERTENAMQGDSAQAEAETAVEAEPEAGTDAGTERQTADETAAPSDAGGDIDALKRQLEGNAPAQDRVETEEPAATSAETNDTTSAGSEGPPEDTANASDSSSSEEVAPAKPDGNTDPASLAEALSDRQPTPEAGTDAEAEAETGTAAEVEGGSETQAQTQADTSSEQPDQTAAQEAADAPRRLEEALAATEEAQKRATEGAPVTNEALAAEAEMPREDDPQAAPQDDPEMTEEVVTEDTARSSSEDFSTAVNAKAGERKDDKDKGLSDFEKVAIAGLGALAVGAILNNGSEVAVNSGDRVVVQNPDGSYGLIKDDNALLRQPGARISTRNYDDGSTRTIARRDDGAQIVTVYDAQRRIVQRTRIEPDGTRYVMIDDSQGADPVQVSNLPRAEFRDVSSTSDEAALRDALARNTRIDRGFTLSQIRQISDVRALAPAISVENVTFQTGSAAIRPEQAEELSLLGEAIKARIDENPREIFLIEGHTDAVGNAAYNLALSDRRAESMALALTEYFDIPPENLVVQGYGEQYLKVDTQGASEENRRVTVRRVTDLLRVAAN